jgi:hypothetical protein
MVFIALLGIGLVHLVRLCALSDLGFSVHYGGEVPFAPMVAPLIGSRGYAEQQAGRGVICSSGGCSLVLYVSPFDRSTISPRRNTAY